MTDALARAELFWDEIAERAKSPRGVQIWTQAQLARYAGVSSATVSRTLRYGHLRPARIPGARLLVDAAHPVVLDWLAKRGREPPPPSKRPRWILADRGD